MKRVVCVWFPGWPLQRLCREQPALKQRPIVLYGDAPRGGFQVILCSRRAAKQGVAPGMPLAEAKGILDNDEAPSSQGSALFERHDPQVDLTVLTELAAACQCYSPVVGLEEGDTPECLLLEISGSQHLFGGENGLVEQLTSDLQQQGFVVRVAVANTIGAAWALAHASGRTHERSTDSLAPLPLAALRLSSPIVETLRELDIHRIEQLQNLPRESLASRFGKEVSRRLDQATGALEELVTPIQPPEPVEAKCEFEEPTGNRRAIEATIHQLLDDITEQLTSSQQSIRSLLLRFGHVTDDTQPEEHLALTIGLVCPRTSARELDELIFMRLERLRLPGAITSIYLRAAAAALATKSQHQLFDAEKQQEQHRLAALIERLGSRLGEQAVLRSQLHPDAQPEYGCRFTPCDDSHSPTCPEFPVPALDRPLHLRPSPLPVTVLSIVPDGPPLRLQWPGHEHQVARNWGPERIETGWWRERPIQRDYYRVETNSGQQFWLFRQRDADNWFLQGAFS